MNWAIVNVPTVDSDSAVGGSDLRTTKTIEAVLKDGFEPYAVTSLSGGRVMFSFRKMVSGDDPDTVYVSGGGQCL